jgi:hypothetical protein
MVMGVDQAGENGVALKFNHLCAIYRRRHDAIPVGIEIALYRLPAIPNPCAANVQRSNHR